MKLRLVIPFTIIALLIFSAFIIYGCKKEKINTPPIISITNPVDGASITQGDEVTISITATDKDGSIVEVGLSIDGIRKETKVLPPFSFIWNTDEHEEGSHIISATATDNENSTASKLITVSIGNLPITDFTSDKTNDTVPLTINFTDLSTNDPTEWSWSFGDGGISSEQNPSYTYADTGSFTVSLTSTNAFGSSTETKLNYIIGGSVVNADFTASDTNGIVPYTVYFSDVSTSNPTSWHWDFGDGTTSTDQNPSHTFTEIGFYTISLTTTNGYGSDTEVKSDFIKGGAIPEADFSNSTSNGVAPLTVGFNDLSTQNPNSLLWDFGDGSSSTEQNPSYTYNEEGSFSVSLTSTNEYGSAIETKTDLIVVGSFPTASFSASTVSGVVPLTVNFIDESSNNTTSWLWDFGDGGTSTEQNPSYIFSEAGNYDISLTSTNEYGSNTKLKEEFIKVIDIAPDISVIDVHDESVWDYLIIGTDDYYYIQSENDIPAEVLFHSSEANKDYTAFFNDVGILEQIVIDDHIIILTNLNGTKADVGIIYPSGESEILRGLETGYNWGELSLKSINSIDGWSDFIGTTAELIAGIPCVLTSVDEVGTIGLTSSILQWTCGNELLNLSINLAAQEIILHTGSENFINLYDINSTGLNCTNSNPLTCIQTIAVAASLYTATQQELVALKATDIEETQSELNKPIAAFTSNKTSGSAPITINFTDQSTNEPTIWQWDFGDGATSEEQNPSHTYENPGTYTVSLTVTNEFGTDNKTKANYIVLINKPVANFTANQTSGSIPFEVSFTDYSTNNPTAWEWNFGDGTTSTQKNPTHTYSTAGIFTVSLTVRNDYGSDTKSRASYITTGSPPVTEFTATPTSGTTPLSVNFTDQSSNSPTIWTWNFGDGNSSTSQNPSHTYSSAGTYTVSLITSNSFGSNTKTKDDLIDVSIPGSKPDVAFTASPTSGAKPLEVYFTDQSTNNPTSWEWDFGDGNNSTSQNPTHTYSNAGTFTISLKASNTYGSNTKTKTDYIIAGSPPIANFTANPTTGTAPLEVNFTNLSVLNPTSWEWNFGDGNTSTQENPVHTYATAGTYSVTLISHNEFGSYTRLKPDYILVTVSGEPLTGSFTDSRDGHTYPTTRIGNQTWMAENLAYLPAVYPSSDDSDTEERYYVYNYEGTSVSSAKATNNYTDYGVLYNWPAAMSGSLSSNNNPSGVKGVCPNGWHLPSDEEWKQLEMTIGMSQYDADLYNYIRGTHLDGEGAKLKSKTGWIPVVENYKGTDDYNFNAKPAGYKRPYSYNAYEFVELTHETMFWTSREFLYLNIPGNAYCRRLMYENASIYRGTRPNKYGMSIRCVKD